MPRRLRIAFLFHFLLLTALGAQAQRTLSWPRLDVTARLDSDGLLHVTERQTMLMSGDWNGGERKFNVRRGQNLTLAGMRRIDPATGVYSDMQQGSVDEVDHFQLVGNRLRWRSRRPSDPPFHNTRLIYVIDYTLAGVLQKKDGATSDILHPTSTIQPPASNIQHRASNIQHRASSIQHLASSIQHPER